MKHDTSHIAMGNGREFDAIRELLDIWGDVAEGIGDDAAVIDFPTTSSLVISTDATIENVHFRRAWMNAHEVGMRGAAAALSDLAAMGATAHSMLVSFAVSDSWRAELGEVARGIGEQARRVGAKIVGGNVTRSETFSITFTVVGSAKTPVRRSGACPGHVLAVTGTLGGPARAIAAFERGVHPEEWARLRFTQPTPRIAEGSWLKARGVSAMIDISDGLLADAGHMATASGVDLLIDAAKLPGGPAVTSHEALASGEEYELLCAMPHEQASTVVGEFREMFGVPITIIGVVTASGGMPSARLLDASAPKTVGRVELPAGHDHFSR